MPCPGCTLASRSAPVALSVASPTAPSPSTGSTSSPKARDPRSSRCSHGRRWSSCCATPTARAPCRRSELRSTSANAPGWRPRFPWPAYGSRVRSRCSTGSRDWSKRIAATRPEARLLLDCARTSLDPERAEQVWVLAGDHLDWAWLLDTARPHGILPLLHHHLRATGDGAVPAPVRAALSRRVEADARRNLRLAGELVRLLDLFARHGVTAVPYKGPLLAVRCYGDLALRPFRDLDFLVRPQDLATAHQVLVADGYRPWPPRTPRQQTAIRTTWHEDAFWRDDDIVELHWALAPREFPLPLDLDDVWARLEPLPLGRTPVRTLCAEHLLLMLCAHGAKHCWERLGWICDVAELLRSTPGLDLPGGLDRARDLGVHRMVLLALRLARDLLDAPLPDPVARRAQADGAVARLVAQVQWALFRHTPGLPRDRPQLSPFHLRAQERWRDRLRYCARVALTPTLGDWAWLRLPDALYPLYYVVRPIRLVVKYGARLIKSAWESPRSRAIA